MKPSNAPPVEGAVSQAMPIRETAGGGSHSSHCSHSSDKVPPSEDEWLRHKSTIKRLYLNEHRPLKEVMEIMKRDYGFSAMSVLLVDNTATQADALVTGQC